MTGVQCIGTYSTAISKKAHAQPKLTAFPKSHIPVFKLRVQDFPNRINVSDHDPLN